MRRLVGAQSPGGALLAAGCLAGGTVARGRVGHGMILLRVGCLVREQGLRRREDLLGVSLVSLKIEERVQVGLEGFDVGNVAGQR